MYLKFFLIITAMVFFYSKSFASGKIVYSKKDDHSQTILSHGDYDDVRVFGNEAHWVIKKKDLSISVVFKDNVVNSLSITKYANDKKLSLTYVLTNKVLHLVSGNVSKIRTFKYTVFDTFDQKQMCTPISNADSLISTLNNKLDNDTLMDGLDNSVDKSCQTIMAGEYDQWEKAVSATIKIDPKTKETPLSTCLAKNPAIASAFGSTPEGQDQLKVLEAKLNLDSAKIYASSDQMKSSITCSTSDKPDPRAQYNENGSIVLLKTTPEKSFVLDAPRVYSHESLHKAGVTDEQAVDKILDICVDGKVAPQAPTIAGKKDTTFNHIDGSRISETTPVKATATISNADATAKAPAQITPEQAQIPTAQQLASTTNINTTTETGVTQAVTQSEQQSSGLVNFANQISAPLLGTPAVAATTTLAATATPTVVSRLPTSVGSSSSGYVAPSTTASTTPTAPASASASSASAPIDVAATAAAINSRANSIAATAPGASGTANGSDFSRAAAINTRANSPVATNASTDLGSSGGDSSAPVVRAAQRQPSSVSSPTIVTAPAKEDLMTYFLKSDYQSARQKLQEPKMQKNLRENDITVTDLSGNTIGAARGKTIILDQGDRFVQQK